MEAVTWLTSHWADEEQDIRIEAAMAKLFCSEAAWRVVDETMQLRGGRGYERASLAQGARRDAVSRRADDARRAHQHHHRGDRARSCACSSRARRWIRTCRCAAELLQPGTPDGAEAAGDRAACWGTTPRGIRCAQQGCFGDAAGRWGGWPPRAVHRPGVGTPGGGAVPRDGGQRAQARATARSCSGI